MTDGSVSPNASTKEVALPKLVPFSPGNPPPEALSLAQGPVDIDVEEVRLAMALNGGVSLAVWMGGVAVELDCARRAHRGTEPGPEGKPRREVYNAICGALQRRLVIDVMSGASAGGLNGSLLAGVIRSGRRLSPEMLRARWIKVGDLKELLQPTSVANPRSLMRGGSSVQDPGIFYEQLTEMFSAVLGIPHNKVSDEEFTSCVAPAAQGSVALDAVLDVMMTNVQGEPRKFRDYWGFDLAAREYRAPFHFRNTSDFTVENLSVASRSSASFPFAFEPFLVTGDSATLAGFKGARLALDGGLLENAPIDEAIRLIPTRGANSQVKRFLCYLNAAPPSADAANPSPQRAGLANVAQWVIDTPRAARFVDQLYAIRDAQKRASVSRGAQPTLLMMDWTHLEATALALLPTYRDRRVRIVAQEVITDPSEADAAASIIAQQVAISWLPTSVDPPSDGADWKWGVRTAERILYLQLDLLRGALRGDLEPSERHDVLSARAEIYGALERLAIYRVVLVSDARVTADENQQPLLAIEGSFTSHEARIFEALTAGTHAFLSILAKSFVADLPNLRALRDILNPSPPPDGEVALEPFEAFLRRALAVEVIQRAFSTTEDIENGQELHFAQITPLAPVRIFSSQPFFDDTVPASGRMKLTGIKVMHFSAFYRKTWRANDFMWGRLDGATRIVDMMVDSTRAAELQGKTWVEPAVLLANAVLPLLPVDAVSDERHALVEEAISNARVPGSGVGEQVLALLGDFEPNSGADTGLAPSVTNPNTLRDLLRQAFQADLSQGDARFSRVVLARALQLEILREEYEHLAAESANEGRVGAFSRPLTKATAAVADSVNAIRDLYRGDLSRPWDGGGALTLPGALGLGDSDETTSDLALGTLARASFAVLAALSGILVIGKLASVVRAPILPVSGAVSRNPRVRLAVVLGFAASAGYLLVRLTTADPHAEAPLAALWNPSVLLTWASVAVILGAIVVPAIRARYVRGWPRRIGSGSLAGLLLIGTLLLPIGLAWWAGGLGLVQLLATPGAEGIPDPWSKAVLVLLLAGPAALSIAALPIPYWSRVRPFVRRVPFDITMAIASLIALYFLYGKLWDAVARDWRGYSIVAAAIATLALASYLAGGLLRRPKKPRTAAVKDLRTSA